MGSAWLTAQSHGGELESGEPLSPSPYERSEEESCGFDAFVLLRLMDSAGGASLLLVARCWMERLIIAAAL
ncbi:hypothetical protein EYF80_002657 [Liparis tanakae]|uniref:Uncharacterized protein n=1 Tax=Liparis tanakae TaxID=230148 RepID=A0A4Z2JC65_9TELE|nr:hypothetical protein EYF80_002657 [Liparis tanakae]